LFKLYAVNTHWLVRGLWKVAKQMVDEFTLSKINLYGGDFQADILHLVPAENLEEKYGGKLPNKVKDFFPP